MKFVHPLIETDQQTLQEAYRHHGNHRVRLRAQAILLSHRGYKLSEISQILESHRDRVSVWMDRWEQKGLLGLYDQPRSGRPTTYTDEELEYFKEQLDQTPQQLELAQAALEARTGKQSGKDTLKRALKKAMTMYGNDVVAR